MPSVVLAFHGCDAAVGRRLLAGQIANLAPSENSYDWLGTGIYFWEADPWRALEWAEAAAENRRMTARPVMTPYVVGAVIDLGRCCNLLDASTRAEAINAFEFISAVFQASATAFPENQGGADRVLRFRDRAVVEAIHDLRNEAGEPPYDSVRAAFPEGDALYPGAGFRARSHIQLAVRNPDCIKGYFRLPGL